MSFTITESFVQQYRSNIIHLSQQKGSRFQNCVKVEADVTGKTCFFERMGLATAVVRTTRHGDTPLVGAEHSRRMASLATYEWADLVDQSDKIRLLIDPASEYVQAGVNAMGRAKDDVIIEAMLGSAHYGETGASTVAITQSIASGSVNLTLAKLAAAKRFLDLAEVDPDIPRFIAVAPKQIEYLLVNVAEVKSADYNSVLSLMKGEINQYYGFTWILSNRLPVDATPDRTCVAWAKDGVALAIGQEVRTEIDKRADKSNSTQIFISMDLGAVRIEEAKVVRIYCTEVA